MKNQKIESLYKRLKDEFDQLAANRNCNTIGSIKSFLWDYQEKIHKAIRGYLFDDPDVKDFHDIKNKIDSAKDELFNLRLQINLLEKKQASLSKNKKALSEEVEALKLEKERLDEPDSVIRGFMRLYRWIKEECNRVGNVGLQKQWIWASGLMAASFFTMNKEELNKALAQLSEESDIPAGSSASSHKEQCSNASHLFDNEYLPF